MDCFLSQKKVYLANLRGGEDAFFLKLLNEGLDRPSNQYIGIGNRKRSLLDIKGGENIKSYPQSSVFIHS